MMKIKQIKFYTICLLLLTAVGCNFNQAQDERNMEPYGGFGTGDTQTFDEYRLNEEEQLMGGGQMDAQINPYGSISNANTDISSDKYPHTKAIQIQQAKYKFVVEGGVSVKHGTGQQTGQVTPAPQQKETPAPQPEAAPKQEAQPAPQPEAVPRQETQPAPKQEVPEQQPTAPVEKPEVATPTPAPQTPQTEQQQPKAPNPAAEGINNAAAKVIELTNAERRKNGLPDYQADTQLSNVAKVKSDDMQQNNYFSHTSPTHGSPFDMIRDHGVAYKSAGENIAQGQRTPEQVVQSWMNSEGHRKNILSADFTHIGVGYNENGHYWTQMFIRK
jgi:uncharacterized YkwD family protein